MDQPHHIAVIMDGNGRWASRRNLPRTIGHSKGFDAAKTLVELAIKYKIKILSVFAFSTENWQRPKLEIKVLMELIYKLFTQEIEELHQNQVKLNVIGDLSNLDPALKRVIGSGIELTKNNQRLLLNIAISYGGKWDLISAVKKIHLDLDRKLINLSQLNEATFAKYLSLGELPDPDLLIRTSGEKRLSNFFLWQSAYTELFFTDVLWPDFDEVEFKAALDFYAARTRKFGNVPVAAV